MPEPAQPDLLGEGVSRDEQRRQIIHSARACFERFGVERTRMLDIAESAGVSRPLLYKVFADRAAVIDAVINRELDRMGADLRAAVDLDAGFVETVVGLSVASVDAGRSNVLLAELFAHREAGSLTTSLTGQTSGAHVLVLGLWHPVFERGREEGVLRTDLKDEDIIEWVMMVHYLFLLRADLDLQRVEEMIRAFLLPAVLAA